MSFIIKLTGIIMTLTKSVCISKVIRDLTARLDSLEEQLHTQNFQLHTQNFQLQGQQEQLYMQNVQLHTQNDELQDLKSKFHHQKQAFTPLTALALLETCINKHVNGSLDDVCDGYQASQLGIALLRTMTKNMRGSRKFHLKAFRCRMREMKAATVLLQALLYWVERLPRSLLKASVQNIQHQRNAVAHNGGFIQAMYSIDATSVLLQEQPTPDSEIVSIYRDIETLQPYSSTLDDAIDRLAKAVKNSDALNTENVNQAQMRMRLKDMITRVFILPESYCTTCNGEQRHGYRN